MGINMRSPIASTRSEMVSLHRIVFLIAVWTTVFGKEQLCPPPIAPDLECSCRNVTAYKTCQDCWKQQPNNEKLNFYSIEYTVSPYSDGVLSVCVTCNYPLTLKPNMFPSIKFQPTIVMQYNNCSFPDFPYARIVPSAAIGALSVENTISPSGELHPLLLQGLENSLQTVSLQGDRITTLHENTFANLTKLTSVSVQNNSLVHLPNSIFLHQQQLQSLNLSGNQLESIADSIFAPLSQLKFLSLSKNRLTTLTSSVFQNLQMLNTLELDSNELTDVPSVVLTGLSQLRNLSVAGNLLNSVSTHTFQSLIRLEILDISHNPITESLARDALSQLTLLNVFIAENCSLKTIPEAFFSNCTNLRVVILKNNQLHDVPHNIFLNNTRLEKLDLSNNNISSLPGEIFASNINLIEIFLSENHFTTLPEYLFRNTLHIKNIFLNSNQLQNIHINLFRNLNNLEILDLSRNEISSLNFDINTNVKELFMSHNKITLLPDNFWFMHKRIKYADFQNNNIISLDVPVLSSDKLPHPILQFNNNDIGTVIIGEVLLYENYPFPPRIEIKIYLQNNPIVCNCQISNFVKYLTRNGKHYARFLDIPQLTCSKPDFLAGKALIDVSITDLFCLYNISCPTPCYCGKRYDGTALVNCSSLHLSKLPTEIPSIATDLNFSSNYLTSIDGLDEEIWQEVENFYFDNNRISSVDNLKSIPVKAKILSLRGNSLSHLTKEFMDYVSLMNISLTLGDNPWICDCSTLQMKHWLTQYNRNIEDFGDVLCRDPILINGSLVRQMIATVPEDSICPPDTWPYTVMIISVSTVAVIAAVVVFITSVLYYRNRRTVLAYTYIHFNSFFVYCWGVEDLDDDKMYDAFVCYSSADRDVVMELISELEENEPRFRLCIHERDWLPGNLITTNIINSVENSKRFILIVSDDFLKSTWFQVEFHAAYNQMMEDRIDRLITIVKGDLPPCDSLDSDLQFLLSSKPYLVWGERCFIEKLRYAMPHRKRKPATVRKLKLNYMGNPSSLNQPLLM